MASIYKACSVKRRSARVIVLTNRPLFHCASFDEDVDPAAQLGYIVPTWLPAEHPSATQLQDMGAPAGTRTAILLPLKAAKAADVQRQLAELAPETILFLRKLRSLVILDKVHNKT